jgi:hypothetical protein
LESNREIRKEMASLAMSNSKDNESLSNSKSSTTTDLNQQFPNLNINVENNKTPNSTISSSSNKSAKN